jgi:hypothetical protein
VFGIQSKSALPSMSRANLFTVSRKPNILFSRKFWTYCKDIVVTHYRSWAKPFLRMFSIASLEHQEFLRLCSMMTTDRISWTRLHMIHQLWWEGSDCEAFNTFGAHGFSTHNIICSCMKACEIHITLHFEMSRPGYCSFHLRLGRLVNFFWFGCYLGSTGVSR